MAELDRLRRINSRQNALVKQLRRAFQHGELTPEGDAAIESVRILEEAIRSGLRLRAVFFSEAALPRAERLLPQISSHAETLLLPDDVFQSAVATENPQGVAALVRIKQHKLEDAVTAPAPLIVVCAGLQDPGNVGTIIRSAEAFGAAGVLLGEGTVSQYNAKVVRASAGSIFRVPVARIELPETMRKLHQHGVKLMATSSHKGTSIEQANFRGGTAIVIGGEGAGVPRDVLRQVDEVVTIPQATQLESLNAGIAASIVLYEAARQRRRTE